MNGGFVTICENTKVSQFCKNAKKNPFVPCRETRKEWPLLTVEAEVNGDSKSTNERGLSLVGSIGLSCWYKRFLFCLGCPSRPGTKYFFFLAVHYFNSFFAPAFY
jgi:hypothetical protein